MYSGIIEFIAEHTLHTAMLSGALAQSKRLDATQRTRLLPSGQFPRKTGELRTGDKRGAPRVSGLAAGVQRLMTDESCFNNLPILVE